MGPSLVPSRYSVPSGIAILTHQVSFGREIRCRVRAKPLCENDAGATAAGVAFASGWPECGSVQGATKLPTPLWEDVSPLQWIGTNNAPRCWPSLTTTFTTPAPCAVEIVAKPPSLTP